MKGERVKLGGKFDDVRLGHLARGQINCLAYLKIFIMAPGLGYRIGHRVVLNVNRNVAHPEARGKRGCPGGAYACWTNVSMLTTLSCGPITERRCVMAMMITWSAIWRSWSMISLSVSASSAELASSSSTIAGSA